MRDRSVDDASCRRIPRREGLSHSASQMESEKAVRHNQEKCAGVMERLRTSGIRPTTARIGVLQAIGAAAPSPICAEDVFRQMLLRGTRASIGTIYRTIHQLEEHGLLLRDMDGARKAHYRIKPAHFDAQSLRLVCPDTGRSVVLTNAYLYAGLLAFARGHGIDLDGQALSVQVLTMAGGRVEARHDFHRCAPFDGAQGRSFIKRERQA